MTPIVPDQSCEKLDAKGLARHYIVLGRKCARFLGAKCVSEHLSRSYGEESLRFTCRQGHNFFLSITKIKQTYIALR